VLKLCAQALLAQLSYFLLMEKKMEIIQAEQVKSVKKNEKGASLVEYALLVALIAIIAIVAVRSLGQNVSSQFSAMSAQIGG
jgi:pilus assembly protein Flp/PilA